MGVRLAVVSTWPEGRPSEHVYELEQERIVIGRRRGSDVHIPHPAVSGHHATLSAHASGLAVTDEGSTNGTRVNGTRVPPGRPKTLRSGDIVEVGGFHIKVALGVAVADATSADRTAALARQIVEEVLGHSDDAAEIVVLNGPNEGARTRVPLPPARLVLGRGEGLGLVLSDADLSREHAELRPDLDGCVVADLGSKNGTFVNEKQIVEKRLRDGDEIRIGRTVIVFRDPLEARVREISDAADVAMQPPAADIPATRAAGHEIAALAAEAAAVARASGDAAPPSAASPPAAAKPNAAKSDLAPERPAAQKSSGLGADALIYLLAGAVLLLSIAGLFVLLR